MLSPTRLPRLFYNNVKSIFWSPYTLKLDPDTLIVKIFHTLFLPITIPVLGIIITIIDFFSRRRPPEQQLKDFDRNLDELPDDQVSDLMSEIWMYKLPESHNSQRLQSKIIKTGQEFSRASNEGSAAKLKVLTENREKINLEKAQQELPKLTQSQFFSVAIIPSKELSEEEKKSLNDYNTKNKADLSKQRTILVKRLVKEYVANEQNEGTKMQQIIVNSVFSKSNNNKQPENKQSENIIQFQPLPI
jgi:hypothetical protein